MGHTFLLTQSNRFETWLAQLKKFVHVFKQISLTLVKRVSQRTLTVVGLCWKMLTFSVSHGHGYT